MALMYLFPLSGECVDMLIAITYHIAYNSNNNNNSDDNNNNFQR